MNGFDWLASRLEALQKIEDKIQPPDELRLVQKRDVAVADLNRIRSEAK